MSILDGFEHCVRENELLAPHTWFRLGGPAQYFAEPTSFDELAALTERCRNDDIPVRVLGGGSNLLVRDEGVSGLVIHLAAPAFCDLKVEGDTVTAGGGVKLAHVISTAVREGLAGLETLVGIPGTVGGALHGNSGSHGGDVGQFAHSATVLTRSGESVTRQRNEMTFSYRQSSLNELVILEAQFKLERGDVQELTKQMQKLWIIRKSSQPMGDQSAGCIFKNPSGASAAMLIEEAGLKGASVGGASISDRHANFIVAEAGASSDDVQRLIDLARTQVSERLGVDLELEIEVW